MKIAIRLAAVLLAVFGSVQHALAVDPRADAPTLALSGDSSPGLSIPGLSIPGLSIPALREPVEIVKDRWGVSHIYARNQHDLFFAQGFNAARDRLFQFEIWRRKALGRLAEIQGEGAIAHDEGARLLRYRGDIDAEMAHYHPDGREIITAFVAGVNAFIDLTAARPELLPFEFELLGIKPGYWTPQVVVSRHNALTGGIASEIRLAKMITALGPERTYDFLSFARPGPLVSKPGIDLALIGDEIMAKYRASRSLPPFQADKLGSNNWVIGGSKTKSSKPIMANDPHRSIQNPSLRYIVHLNAPGWNVIGAGEPVLPGISIGHNGHGAWGLTIFQIDQEDLYVYQTNPDNPDQYRYQGGWKDMAVETEVITVHDADDVTVALKYSVHGPIIHEDPAHHLAYGLRAAWLEQGSAPYLASLRMDQATSWEEFRQACEYSGLPGENMVWADSEGNIGWQAVGYTPVRFGWDGRLPVPGDGSFEWQGMVPIKSMPHVSNPESGWFGTANNNMVPQHYPNIFTDFYSDPARANRLAEVLNNTHAHTIADSGALQYDNKSMTAEQLTPLVAALKVPRDLRGAIDLLKRWDFMMDRSSPAALIYDKWELAMLERLNDAVLPDHQGARLVTRVKLLEWVLAPPEFVFGARPHKARDKMMLDSLREANAQLVSQFGSDKSRWQYGDVHVAQIEHPLNALVSFPAQQQLTIGPLPRGGASNTLNANHGNTRQTSGASFRIIVDTADWDATVATNTPGQSGDPRSPYYANLFNGWNEGVYFPLYYSRKQIDAVADERIILHPDQ